MVGTRLIVPVTVPLANISLHRNSKPPILLPYPHMLAHSSVGDSRLQRQPPRSPYLYRFATLVPPSVDPSCTTEHGSGRRRVLKLNRLGFVGSFAVVDGVRHVGGANRLIVLPLSRRSDRMVRPQGLLVLTLFEWRLFNRLHTCQLLLRTTAVGCYGRKVVPSPPPPLALRRMRH